MYFLGSLRPSVGQVPGTPQVQPSEVIVTLAYGDVKTFASSGGREPSSSDFGWSGGRVLRLPGWFVPLGGDTVVVMVEATSDARYRVLAASDEDILRLEDGMPVQMVQDEPEMRYVCRGSVFRWCVFVCVGGGGLLLLLLLLAAAVVVCVPCWLLDVALEGVVKDVAGGGEVTHERGTKALRGERLHQHRRIGPILAVAAVVLVDRDVQHTSELLSQCSLKIQLTIGREVEVGPPA